MGRNIHFAPGEFYHLYNRGTEKRRIFMSKSDYDRFLALLYICNGDTAVHLQLQGRTLKEVGVFDRGKALVELCAYCLMPNHFHLIARELGGGGMSRFMQKLTTGYTMYFNKRHERSGALFQGKFKASQVDDDRYLKYLIAYVHLNPTSLIEPEWKEHGITNERKARSFLEEYAYSSYPEFCEKTRMESVIINKSALPDYFESADAFKESVAEWLGGRDNFKVGP